MKKSILSAAVLILSSHFLYGQISADLLIRNGKIIDGTGNSWYHGDVAVKDGKIIKMGYIQQSNAGIRRVTKSFTIDEIKERVKTLSFILLY
jgi:N-acyl-D-amino-acid deacylase